MKRRVERSREFRLNENSKIKEKSSSKVREKWNKLNQNDTTLLENWKKVSLNIKLLELISNILH